MSHITLAQQGIAAVDNRNWDEAITKLSKALQTSPSPLWLIARSKALINAGRFEEALEDAELAWHKAYERNKRELLSEAHYRRAVAYYRLKQYANADCCCIYAMRLIKGFPAVEKKDPNEKFADENKFWLQTLEDAKAESAAEEGETRKEGGLNMALGADSKPQMKEWRMASTLRIQILFAMEKLPADDVARKVTVTHKPLLKELSDRGLASASKTETKPATQAPAVAKPVVPADAPVRLQDFQSDSTMSVSIFSKGVQKDLLQVEYLPHSVTLNPIIYPNGDEKAFRLDLWGEIDTELSKHTVTPSKVELVLKKKTAGKWAQLKSEKAAVDDETSKKTDEEERQKLEILKEARQKAMVASESATASTTTPAETTTSSKPSYPTSSKSGPKNWDTIADESDHEEEDGVNSFFKKIYKGATPEQQRAMMKSFTESNGTSLSTDWSDVKDRKVETVPPEGVEAKEWS